MIDQHHIDKHWSEIKSQILSHWNKLNERDIDGMTLFNEYSANYSGLKQNTNETNTAPDEFKPNHVPQAINRTEDITSRRSNSSANTTSTSALTSSESFKEL